MSLSGETRYCREIRSLQSDLDIYCNSHLNSVGLFSWKITYNFENETDFYYEATVIKTI